jgi:CRISPR-associated endonuclease Cas2
MNYFLAYDITDDRLRKKIADCMLRYGAYRIQYSLFLAPKFSPAELSKLQMALQRLLANAKTTPTDSIVCLPVEKDAWPKLVWMGQGENIKKITEQVTALVV